jgi:hypothetical protein
MFMHSSYIAIDKEYEGKRLFVFHGGTAYRQNYEALNKHFNPIVEKCVVQTADLLGKGAKNEVWVLPPVDTKNIQPVYEPQRDKPVVAHYPSNEWKGTPMIVGVIGKLMKDHDFYWECSSDILPWEENMKRMAQCDIYIDGVCPTQGKERYGEWGVQALEAMALGKVTLAHGSVAGPILILSENALTNYLRQLLDRGTRWEKMEMRRRVEEDHSYEAVGTVLKEKVFEL